MSRTNSLYKPASNPWPILAWSMRLIPMACLFIMLSACGGAQDGGSPQPPPKRDAEVTVLTTIDLDDLTTRGLPVVLNFGDDSQASEDTLAVLNKINGEYGDAVLIVTVDLALNPEAREGFPIQVKPSQFFYMADGKPMSLAINIGVITSTFLSVDTEEPVFTVHEGALSEDELLKILTFMGVV